MESGAERLRVVVWLRTDHADAEGTDKAPAVHIDARTPNAVCVPRAGFRCEFNAVVGPGTPASSSEEIYAATVQPLISSVLAGYNACTISLGDGCDGYTPLWGASCNGGPPGAARTAVRDLLLGISSLQRKRAHGQVVVHVCAGEVGSTGIVDLLAVGEDGKCTGGSLASVDEEDDWISRITLLQIATADQLYQIVDCLRMRRESSEVNACGEGVHLFFKVFVEVRRQRLFSNIEGTYIGSLTLVDLGAGAADPGGSLDCRCAALAGEAVSAFPRTALLRLLEDELGGNCRTTILAVASTSDHRIRNSAAALHFAAHAKMVVNYPRVNKPRTADHPGQAPRRPQEVSHGVQTDAVQDGLGTEVRHGVSGHGVREKPAMSAVERHWRPDQQMVSKITELLLLDRCLPGEDISGRIREESRNLVSGACARLVNEKAPDNSCESAADVARQLTSVNATLESWRGTLADAYRQLEEFQGTGSEEERKMEFQIEQHRAFVAGMVPLVERLASRLRGRCCLDVGLEKAGHQMLCSLAGAPSRMYVDAGGCSGGQAPLQPGVRPPAAVHAHVSQGYHTPRVLSPDIRAASTGWQAPMCAPIASSQNRPGPATVAFGAVPLSSPRILR
eukprot:gnl/TRDRNA2_/TRDRNA2_131313_c0_seq2.p1 gnl/TRDRNA2_/TRDRNA2_131313_c0~~gnl/TRDRNA2_/TRDRNA2_131313_c0_seq2.p1  ORF type:complete len:620 (+),score=91.07 gnl/TRDRNA2_/TRDRNA2_131313_c0_seq2:60-1919(+)